MALTRRQFLTLAGGSTAGAILFQACGVPEAELLVRSPVEMPEDLVTGLDNWYATLCRQCPTSEGLVVRVMEGRAKKVEGNVDYPINRGKHSARCEATLQSLYHPDRISAPLLRVGRRGSGQFREIGWDDALGRVARQLRELDDRRSMVMVTDPVSAHLGLVVDRFVSRFGVRHYGYEPLEKTNLRMAMKQVFDQDVMPDFDIENAGFVLSFGADFLNTWVSPVRYARGYGEFRQGDRERGTLVHVDSRFSMTGANADRWVHVKPGMEGILALSIAQVIISSGDANAGAARRLMSRIDIDDFAPDRVADKVGVPAEVIATVAHDFASHGPGLAIGGGSAAAHTNGLFNLRAIYSLNHLVGSVGREGGIILNPEPPLADLPLAPSVASFAQWEALADEMDRGDVRVLMVRGADPWHGLPRSTGFQDASFNVPFIFSFSGFMDDTTAMADLVLPQHDPLEDWGSDVPNVGPGYQTIGFQQPVVRPFFENRGRQLGTNGFGDSLLDLAELLGMDLGLPGTTFKDLLRDGSDKLFELGRGSVRAATARSFWHGVLQRGGWWDIDSRGPSRVPAPEPIPTAEDPQYDGNFEFHLVPFATTGIGEGSGAALPWMQATPDPVSTATWQTWVEINREKARDMGIEEGDVVRIVSAHGSIEALAYPHPGMPPDVVSVPVGQGHTRGGGRYAKDRGANVYSILAPAKDGESGALAWAATRVDIEPTSRWVRLPKFENTVDAPPEDEHQEVIKLTPVDS